MFFTVKCLSNVGGGGGARWVPPSPVTGPVPSPVWDGYPLDKTGVPPTPALPRRQATTSAVRILR